MTYRLTYGIFHDEESAARAVNALVEAHFNEDEITVLTRGAGDGDAQVESLPVVQHDKGAEGASVGAILGALGTVALVFAGPWGGVGPLVLAIQAAIGGGASGAALGLLAGLDWRTAEVAFDEEHFPPESFLVGALSDQRDDAARDALKEAGAPTVFDRTPNVAADEFQHLTETSA